MGDEVRRNIFDPFMVVTRVYIYIAFITEKNRREE